jgi:hypothetical protein
MSKLIRLWLKVRAEAFRAFAQSLRGKTGCFTP